MLLFSRKLKHGGARRLTVGPFEERSIKKISQNSSENLKVSAKIEKKELRTLAQIKGKIHCNGY